MLGLHFLREHKARAYRRDSLKRAMLRIEAMADHIDARTARREQAYAEAQHRSKRNYSENAIHSYFLLMEHNRMIDNLVQVYNNLRNELDLLH